MRVTPRHTKDVTMVLDAFLLYAYNSYVSFLLNLVRKISIKNILAKTNERMNLHKSECREPALVPGWGREPEGRRGGGWPGFPDAPTNPMLSWKWEIKVADILI